MMARSSALKISERHPSGGESTSKCRIRQLYIEREHRSGGQFNGVLCILYLYVLLFIQLVAIENEYINRIS